MFTHSKNFYEQFIYRTVTQRLLFAIQYAFFSFSIRYPTHSVNATLTLMGLHI